MSLYKQWTDMVVDYVKTKGEAAFWREYGAIEKSIYTKLLANHKNEAKGTIKNLGEEYGTSSIFFMGFLDGINESLIAPIDLEKLDENSEIELKIDFEKLEVNIDRIESKANLINSLNSIKGVISSYHEKCNRLNLHECASIAEKLMKSIDITSELIKMEIEKQKEQLGNVNLFYQNYMVERAIKIAYASLFVSALAFLLTVLQAVHIL
jgi:hypothetical protein